MSEKNEQEYDIMTEKTGVAGRIARAFIDARITVLIVIAAIILGIGSTLALPREEEPQIIVPMIDIFVQMPGQSAREVESYVTRPMEKLLWEIPGVEYVYTTSSAGMAMAVVRFYVGEDEEEAIVRLQSKLSSNFDRIPQCASPPLVKPRYIDDVPILALTFWSEEEDHYTLRRVAAEVENLIKRENDVSLTSIIGGNRRQVEVTLDIEKLSDRRIDPIIVMQMISASNTESHLGSHQSGKEQVSFLTKGFLRNAQEVGSVVVGVAEGRPIYLRDVAQIRDGPEEPDQYVFMGTGPAGEVKGLDYSIGSYENFPAVTVTLAKRKGTNAIAVARRVLERVEDAKGAIIPDNINVTVTRHYGETAKEKSDELLFHMGIAIFSVTILVGFALGKRESLVVALAIPVTLALTLTVFYLYGYTLNRITLFALIFSIGILVDDAIVVVENMVRHFHLPQNKGRPFVNIAVEAVNEVGDPTILATLTVIAAILPMAFVGGLMGPYMRPIPVGATAAMIWSLLVAFIVTPWAGLLFLKNAKSHDGPGESDKVLEGWSTKLYRRVMTPLIERPVYRWSFLVGVVVLLLSAMALVGVGWVKVKMLPFDNKSEFQVIIDMPESATLEETSACALEMTDYLRTVNEVTDYQVYIGTSSPFNFNGLVRHYYLRKGAAVADIQVNLAAKHHREDQSHDIAKRVRPELKKIGDKYGASLKVAEVPPGPPVLSTLVAEIYGPDYERQIEIAKQIKDVFEDTAGVVDVDWYVEEPQKQINLIIDKEKAMLHGISAMQINSMLDLSLKPYPVGILHVAEDQEIVPIRLKLPLSEKSRVERLTSIKVKAADGSMVALSELVKAEESTIDTSIYHKNLTPVVYITADVANEKESPVYAILEMKKKVADIQIPEGYEIEQLTAKLPDNLNRYSMKWDGEWHITFEVFRDLGIAFAAALVLIFIIVVAYFKSFSTPLVILAAIPFSLVGILPAHGMMGAFFTATSMIGFIAGAGIVVRNSIILVDFIELRLSEGMPLNEAVIDAGAVRFRPMLLTAAAVVVGASVILFDPIFQGLAISLMAGEIASLLLSRMTVPILYFLDKRWEHEHEKSSEKEETKNEEDKEKEPKE
jgi:multidrug efflux pump subunit AcrB